MKANRIPNAKTTGMLKAERRAEFAKELTVFLVGGFAIFAVILGLGVCLVAVGWAK